MTRTSPGAADVERDRPEQAEAFVRNAGRHAGVVEEPAHDGCVEQDLDAVPLAPLQASHWRGQRQRDAGRRRDRSPTPAATSSTRRRPRGRGRWRRRRHADHAADVAEPFALHLAALRVEAHGVGRDVFAFGQRQVDALEALGGAFGAQQDARAAPAGAAHRRVEADVLVGVVEDEPPAGGARLRGADQLTVLGTPGRLTERVPAREAGTGEPHVGHERRTRRRRWHEPRVQDDCDGDDAGEPGARHTGTRLRARGRAWNTPLPVPFS